MIRRLDRSSWWLIGASVLTALGFAAFHLLFEKHRVEVDTPPSGPAAHDPFYALRLYLQERGLEVNSTRRWDGPPARETAVFWFNYEQVPHGVREWLGEGGRLWAFTDPDGSFDWEPTPWVEREPGERPPGEGQAEEPCDDVDCWSQYLAERERYYCGERDAQCLYAAQYDYGEGCLTLVGDDALTNGSFVDGVNAARVDALLRCPTFPAAVLIVRGLQAPWVGELLWERAPQALLVALVLVLLCLWRAARYMGPPAPAPVVERRRWMEHVGAVGQLAARTGLDPLLARARQELWKRLALRVPELRDLKGEARLSAVGARLGVPEATVQRALGETPRGTPSQTLSITRAMLALWRKL